MTHHSLLLAHPGESQERPLEVFSPYSGEVVGTIDQASASQAEAALEIAHATFRDRSAWLSVEARCAVLEKAAAIMQARFEELAVGAAAEGGKPLIDSRVEVARAIEGVKLCMETIRSDAGAVIPISEPAVDSARVAYTLKEPVGVVVAISAFNHPLNLIVHQVAAAIAAGCPTLVKPAATTPLSCHRFVSILREAGLPMHWCQLVLPASLDVATALVTDSRVGFFSFIGSARVGWMLRSKLSPGTRCALEHGGAAPLVVDHSANTDKLIPAVLKGGYYHAGQVCVSVQRVYVHDSLFEEVCDQLITGVRALRVGDPLAEDTEVGPLITAAEVDRVHDWLQQAVADGAQLPTGGELLSNGCLQPALIVQPSLDSLVSQREIFGPAVCVYRYQDASEAIAMANSLPYAFQAAVFSQDIDRAMAIGRALDASAVMINDHTAFRQDVMPFAGLRESGLGVGGIPYTIEDMQVDKMMVLKTRTPG